MLRGPKAQGGEIWSLDKGVPALLSAQALDDPDEDDTRIEWVANRWSWNIQGGQTRPVPAATLDPKPIALMRGATQPPSEPGNVAFNPFVETKQIDAPAKVHDDDGGIPWIWIGIAAALALGLTVFFFTRGSGGGGGGAKSSPTSRSSRQNARR
ncbi:MAG TPA: hypothetical protein VH328_03705 [Burkholderiaceae bacterium]|nr:hypothetical protein [Burkholderiaceae bacterium]